MSQTSSSCFRTELSAIALVGGPLLAAIIWLVLPDTYVDAAGQHLRLGTPARGTIAMTGWMAVWWLSEAVPVSATALLPVTLFPILELNRITVVAAAYAHPLIFLFLGGFIVSIAIEKWYLHQWIARHVVHVAGNNARRLVGGFMLVTAFASMWLSNTATTVMMLPIALSATQAVAHAGDGPLRNFAPCVLLGVAYAASIGGMTTLIGSPPNLFAAGYLAEHLGRTVDFRTWMSLAAPIVLFLLPATWWLLTRVLMPLPDVQLDRPGTAPTPWSSLQRGAHRVALVFLFTATAWMTRGELNDLSIAGIRPFSALTDAAIALLAALVLFILPSGNGRGERLMTWADAERLPIGTLILFGGGLALASTLQATGADGFIGAQLAALGDAPGWLVLAAVVVGVILLTELTSNIATTTTLVPILAAVALHSGFDATALVIAAALSASAAFMLPVATPPNAIVFGSGQIAVSQMARAGLVLNIVAMLVVSLAGCLWFPQVLGSG